MLAIKIRKDENINDISVSDTEYKLSMMADDTTLILKDLNSLEIAINIFEQFRQCSGLKLNLNKTEIIPIGMAKNLKIQYQNTLATLKSKMEFLRLWGYGSLVHKMK